MGGLRWRGLHAARAVRSVCAACISRVLNSDLRTITIASHVFTSSQCRFRTTATSWPSIVTELRRLMPRPWELRMPAASGRSGRRGKRRHLARNLKKKTSAGAMRGLLLLLTCHVQPIAVAVDLQCDQVVRRYPARLRILLELVVCWQGFAPRVVDNSQRLLIDFKCVQLDTFSPHSACLMCAAEPTTKNGPLRTLSTRATPASGPVG